ncbi:bacteriocin [Iningainema tapete]|uniref:Bacteriocin n=1 Tax=Iningainema tapete BLCC-T55 TaxID=2748662 RepID=A0A8J6XDT7_9CYAN|nr:bacteriocin [Iningainema tapete]MBD2771758.1 bacteriocin [Iningainema tapete BLCC-T55]
MSSLKNKSKPSYEDFLQDLQIFQNLTEEELQNIVGGVSVDVNVNPGIRLTLPTLIPPRLLPPTLPIIPTLPTLPTLLLRF